MSAPTISRYTINSVEDRHIVLSNSTIARKLEIGTNWNTLRILVRLSFDDFGANLTGTPRFWLGVLSNPSANVANGPLGSTTSHFVGGVTGHTTWTRSTTPTRYYMANAAAFTMGKKVGGTTTLTNGTLFFHFYAQPSSIRTLFGVEIIKGSPNYTIHFLDHWYDGSTLVADVPLYVMQKCMTASTLNNAISTYLPAATYGTYGSLSVTTAVDEGTDGPLNAICCAWDQVTPVCRISDLLWAKIA